MLPSVSRTMLRFESWQVSPVRILTVGVVLCAGGVLAALPFRIQNRQAVDLDHPARATGPVPDRRDSAAGHLIVAERTEPDELARLQAKIDFQPSDRSNRLVADRPVMDLPLTYHDLAVPVQPHASLSEEFNALAGNRKPLQGKAINAEIGWADGSRRFAEESRLPDGWAERFERYDPRPEHADDRSNGSLPRRGVTSEFASVGRPEASAVPRLPKQTSVPTRSPPREKHWIVQP